MPSDDYPISRACDRTPVQMAVSLLIESDQNRVHDGLAVDLSPHGARLRTSANLMPGDSVDLILLAGSRELVPSSVVWVGEIGPGCFREAGLKFDTAPRLPGSFEFRCV